MMDTHNLPKMVYSYKEGWQDLIQVHPSVSRLFAIYVVPMSLIPPVMFLYAMMVTPGAIFPALVPQITAFEAISIAVAFFLVELAMVALMASIIQQMGDVVEVKPAYQDAFLLAAVAPTPLWLATLALFIPSVWVNGVVVAAAWVASAALIYHGVAPLFKLEDRSKIRLMGTFILMAGIIAWMALLVVLVLLLSMILGFR
jgi:hypothetical protein